MATKIEWANETWNPITGCTPISEGCQNCYAKRMANRLRGRYGYPKYDPFKPATFHPDKIDINMFVPGKKIFVCSMGDLFHEWVNIRGDDIRDIFRCMSHHENTFLLLTKRPNRMRRFIEHLYGNDFPEQMPHIWLGVTVENQKTADERIPILMQIPAKVRFVSVEPMLGLVDLSRYLWEWFDGLPATKVVQPSLDWVICGAETGPVVRIMKDSWATNLYDQCKAASVPFFFKKSSKHSNLVLPKEFPTCIQNT